MILARSWELIYIATADILPRTVLNNNEESLSQSVLEAAVSEIRTLCEREDPELKDKPKMETMDAPLAGIFVDLISDAAPMSKVNEFVNLEVLS